MSNEKVIPLLRRWPNAGHRVEGLDGKSVRRKLLRNMSPLLVATYGLATTAIDTGATMMFMVRTLDLAQWAGQWVAVDARGRVHASAIELGDLVRHIEQEQLAGVEVMRAPVPGEPLVFGLG
jgi:hypothetical protein